MNAIIHQVTGMKADLLILGASGHNFVQDCCLEARRSMKRLANTFLFCDRVHSYAMIRLELALGE